eukprot:13938-Heterococcus_DN1.PRE.3
MLKLILCCCVDDLLAEKIQNPTSFVVVAPAEDAALVNCCCVGTDQLSIWLLFTASHARCKTAIGNHMFICELKCMIALCSRC